MNIQFKSLGFVLSILCFSLASNLYAASFNCEATANETEQAICNNAELSALDSILGDLWDDVAARNDDLVEAQRAWLIQRNSCGSNAECLKQSYLERLSEDPFYLRSFESVELYDFHTRQSAEYMITSSFLSPYNALFYVYRLDAADPVRLDWLSPSFGNVEVNETCEIRVFSSDRVEFEVVGYQTGWLSVDPAHEYSERPVMAGEVSVYTKWVGHGDLSSDVTYRLIDGQFAPDRALVDSCQDQQKAFASVFFDYPQTER